MNAQFRLTPNPRSALAQRARASLAAGLKAGYVAALVAASSAHAQIAKVNTVMQNVQLTLVGVAVTIFTIAIMFAGFKMAFQNAKWTEVSNVVFGGILVGGAAGIAAWLIN